MTIVLAHQPIWIQNSHLNKRQKSINKNKARNTREHSPTDGSIDDDSNGVKSSRPLWADPLVCETIYTNDMWTDEL